MNISQRICKFWIISSLTVWVKQMQIPKCSLSAGPWVGCCLRSSQWEQANAHVLWFMAFNLNAKTPNSDRSLIFCFLRNKFMILNAKKSFGRLRFEFTHHFEQHHLVFCISSLIFSSFNFFLIRQISGRDSRRFLFSGKLSVEEYSGLPL